MTSVRKLSAVAVVTALLFGAAAPLVAAEPAHNACAARQHACGQTARITPCCCPDNGQQSANPAPVPTRIQASPTFVALAVTAHALPAVATAPSTALVRLAWPRRARLDLPTLFSTLLI